MKVKSPFLGQKGIKQYYLAKGPIKAYYIPQAAWKTLTIPIILMEDIFNDVTGPLSSQMRIQDFNYIIF